MNLKEVHRDLRDLFNQELTNGRKRHLVFWYDEAGEFAEDIDELDLEGVRIWKLSENNLFRTKYELEKVDCDSHFLIYANMARPAPREDWLLDQYKLGFEFSTDRTTVMMREWGVTDATLKPVFYRYARFFNNKARRKAFASYRIDTWTEENIAVTVLAVLCKSPINTMDEVLKSLFRHALQKDDSLWEAIEKYGDIGEFWQLIEKYYGYTLEDRSLLSLMAYFVITYLSETLSQTAVLPEVWDKYVAVRPMNIVVFMNQFMNHRVDRKLYHRMADQIAEIIHLKDVIPSWEIEDFLAADAFREFDEKIIAYLQQQLVDEVSQFNRYLEIIEKRRTLHWFEDFQHEYEAIRQAIRLLKFEHEHEFIPEQSAFELFQSYSQDYFICDTCYRKFYVAYNQMDEKDRLSELRDKVENVYTNGFLNELSVKWTQGLRTNSDWPIPGIESQEKFYRTVVQPYVKKDERVFVIISDGLRYEAAKELLDVLNRERKASTEISAMQSVLPSYTDLGMASLLPHREIKYSADESEAFITVDGLRASNTNHRNQLLQKFVSDAIAIRYKDITTMNRTALRKTFTGKKLIYIYHNTIDARGDHAATETEVFDGVTEAIGDLRQLVNRLVNNISASNIVITADHGFLYQRAPLANSHKLPKATESTLLMKKRFIVSQQVPETEGTMSFSMEDAIDHDPPLFVTVPNGIGRFAIQGAGANYVHGGAMLQEIVIPVIIMKNDRSSSSKNAVRQVDVKMTTPSRKITNTVTWLEFFQTERVEEKRRPLRLKLYFVDEAGKRISNENIIIAASTSSNPVDRTYREKFVFKNMVYDRRETYVLVMEDEEDNGSLYEKIPFSIDIAFSSDV